MQFYEGLVITRNANMTDDGADWTADLVAHCSGDGAVNLGAQLVVSDDPDAPNYSVVYIAGVQAAPTLGNERHEQPPIEADVLDQAMVEKIANLRARVVARLLYIAIRHDDLLYMDNLEILRNSISPSY